MFKSTCEEEFLELTDPLLRQLESLRDTYLNAFDKSVKKAIKDRQDALSNELRKKVSNEGIITQINDLRKKKELLPQEIQRINAVMEDLQ